MKGAGDWKDGDPVEVKGVCDELGFCDSNQCRSATWMSFDAMFEVGVGCRAENGRARRKGVSGTVFLRFFRFPSHGFD